MGFFDEFLPTGRGDLPQAPSHLLSHAKELATSVKSVSEAFDALHELTPYLQQYAPSNQLYLACGTLLEKTRQKNEMLESWQQLYELFPDDPLTIRMLLRWYKRESRVQEGTALLGQLTKRWIVDAKQAEKIILAHREIHTFDELDDVMIDLKKRYPENNRLRVLYIKSLRDQGRLVAARQEACDIVDRKGLGATAIELLDAVLDDALLDILDGKDERGSIIGAFVAPFLKRDIALGNDRSIGQVVFYTGQLGAGGAERQMTRIAAEMQTACAKGNTDFGGYRLSIPAKVCVRDIDPGSGRDFFLPVLEDAGVDTHVLVTQSVPDISTLNLSDQQSALFRLLPNDIRDTSLRLTQFLRSVDAEVVYYWQDAAVLTGVLAALMAGVPRIIASFRGLPPNIRTEFMRPEYVYLYKTIAKVPGVIFTANSQATATAYEDWLKLKAGSIKVLHNAVPDLTADSEQSDLDAWMKIKAMSPNCTKTVIGVFRFDHNKRPQYWVQIAVAYARNHPDTRFVIVGGGDEFDLCTQLIRKENMESHIFLAGRSNRVGFWMHQADMMMHLARFEGLPNVVIEGQLCKLPVLATPAGGTADVIDHQKTGILLSDAEEPDRDEILAALEMLLNDPHKMAAWGELARKRALEKFAMESALAATLRLFRA